MRLGNSLCVCVRFFSYTFYEKQNVKRFECFCVCVWVFVWGKNPKRITLNFFSSIQRCTHTHTRTQINTENGFFDHYKSNGIFFKQRKEKDL